MLALVLAAAAAPPEVAPPPRAADPFAKWEKDIAAIEKRLAAKPPKPGGVFFAGSSSIVKWDLKKAFPGTGHVNVGFGGSVIADSTHFAPRILAPYRPNVIVFYAGDNDVARGAPPDQVLADFKEFVAAARKGNSDCRVFFIAIKPSVARRKQFEVQKMANALVKAYCESHKGLAFIDVVPLMLRADGTPDPELFVKDGLHLSETGYAIWNAEVRKLLK